MLRSEIVSDPSEDLILVDSDDREIGALAKRECHLGEGVLHRAFSIFIVNSQGAVLLQRRAAEKPLWPMYWSNAVCSHPRQGETMSEAMARRMLEELGVECKLRFLYKFEYHANYKDVGSERELCSVYIGGHDGPFDPNRSELADLRFFTREELSRRLAERPEQFTPWFKMEWRLIEAGLDACGGEIGRLQVRGG